MNFSLIMFSYCIISWLDKKGTVNNIKQQDNKCFQYVVTATLNCEEIKEDPQRKTKIKPFINKYK